MSIFKLSILIILLSLAGNVSAEVYRWTDKDGNVHFGDRPEGKNAELQKYKFNKSPERIEENRPQRLPYGISTSPARVSRDRKKSEAIKKREKQFSPECVEMFNGIIEMEKELQKIDATCGMRTKPRCVRKYSKLERRKTNMKTTYNEICRNSNREE